MQQLYRLLIFLIQPYIFRATNSLPTGAKVEMERSSISTVHRSEAVSVHYTKSCIYTQDVLLRMDEFVARNM